ncbi:MAG: chromosome partitioning protein ParB [Lentisphaeria bacterium]|nr:chromosome partitioning protein ParB [Lentisphaeria bacterium]
MSETVERTSLDLRFQSYRLRNEAVEARLLASIAERDIEQPLAGVDTPQGRLLLDGFKRYRCAAKLGIECVPYVSLGEEEAMGIVRLMRVAKQSTLSILEQARFVVELVTMHDMSNADVAEMLSRSKGWVSMRRSLLKEMSQRVQEVLFRGGFPAYSYMVTLRPFMRMNGVGQDEIERFVQAVAGQRLSVREIELLAHGYFRGPSSLRQAIGEGKWKWSLQQMQTVPEDPEGCNDVELALLRELERLLKSVQHVMTRCDDPRLQTRAFHAQANLLVASLLSRRELFFKKMEEFHDRSGHA